MKARVVGRAGSVATPRAVIECPDLDVYEFRLGMWLSTHTGEYLSATSQREMARRLGMGNKVTDRALTTLERLGVVTIERPGGTRSLHVIFNVEAWEKLGQLTPTGSVLTPTGSITDPHGVTKEREEETQELQQRSTTPSPPGRPRKRDEIWDAVVEVCGDVERGKGEGRRGRVVAQLKRRGATAEDVRRAAKKYRQTWPRADLTDTALERHWERFAPKAGSSIYDDDFPEEIIDSWPEEM